MNKSEIAEVLVGRHEVAAEKISELHKKQKEINERYRVLNISAVGDKEELEQISENYTREWKIVTNLLDVQYARTNEIANIKSLLGISERAWLEVIKNNSLETIKTACRKFDSIESQ